MRETILTLILCINLSINVYAQDNETIAEPVNIEQEVQNEIDQLDKSDLKQWFIQYKQIQAEYSYVLDPDETIYDVFDKDEINLALCIIEAESGVCDFNGKLDVACVLINRLKSPNFPKTLTKIIKEKHQFSTYSNGAYKKVIISEDSRLALEYAFQIGDISEGATYFHSAVSKWHKNNLHFIKFDGWHYLYKEKIK